MSESQNIMLSKIRHIKETHTREAFPGGPIVKTQRFHCRDPRFNRETKILHTGQAAKSKNKEILYDSTDRKFKNRKINVIAEKWFLVGDGGRQTGKGCKRNFWVVEIF